MTQLATPLDGSPLDHTEGSTLIRLTRNPDGSVHLYVQAGPNRVPELSKTYSDEQHARSAARVLAAGLREGISIHQFVSDAIAANQVIAAAERIVADAAQPQPEPTYRAVRPTRTRVFCQDLTPAQRRIVAGHQGGVINCGRGTGVSPASVRALHDKLGGELISSGTSRYGISGLRLPATVIEQLAVAA